ncbi:MAG: oxygenase MpaB family protein [Pseudomonadota bacterium]
MASTAPRALRLPPLLLRAIDGAVLTLLQPEPGRRIDFSAPAGEAALAASDSVAWRVFRNPLSVFIGGVAAVVLELAEPSVRAGVWEHSSFKSDPLRRLQRTGLAAMVTVYGPRSMAEAMIDGVVRAHDRVRGHTSAGVSYSANDVRLLDWVQATASFGFVQAYRHFVRPLDDAEVDRFYADSQTASALYGALGAPRSARAQQHQFERMLDALEPSDVILEFLAIMRTAPLLPWPLRPLQRLLVRAAVDILPVDIRRRLALGPALGLRAIERSMLRRAGAWVDRIVLPSSPAAQACRRLGVTPESLLR